MQTLRKKNSPCKYKNEPSRFLGEGITFKAKLIGILEVNEARGDKMCQDALNDLKTAIRAAGEHKQRITISIAIDGLRLRDEKTGDYMYHHPVHKISFIAQDMSDSRAFGYIFGSPDTGHRFFGIKTDKTASQVVITMRDLFQVVFELKKKEIEMAKHHIEQHQIKYGSTSFGDTVHSTKDDTEGDKGKGKYPLPLKTSCITSNVTEASASTPKSNNTSEAIADLLDLEHELNSIQQGINQMERITPSDPFGPISKGDPFLDPFDDSFPSKTDKQPEAKVPPPSSTKPSTSRHRTPSQSSSKDASDIEKPSSLFGSAASTNSKTHFFSQFSPGISKSKTEDAHWFDQETESLFNDTGNVNNTEPTSSPVTFHTPTAETEQSQDDRKSPVKADVFTELDPLGTGRVKPYVDKKDFFQELKNPPKKILKELLTENSAIESTHYFPAHFESNKSPQSSNQNPSKESSVIKNTLVSASSNILNSFPSKDSTSTSRYSRIDPFDDTDPFEKADPFLEESFPQSIGFPPLFSGKTSFDGVFQEKSTSRYEKVPSKSKKEDAPPKMSPPKSSLFSAGMSSLHGPLRVSLPPEKLDTSTPISISTITSKFRSSPSPPEDTKTHRRKYYQTLKQSNDERSDDYCVSPPHEELYNRRSPKFGSHMPSRSQTERKSPYKEKSYSVQSPLPVRYEKGVSKMSSSVEFLDATPDPPPRPKQALFSIKPPPLPPKKQNQPNFRPPPRPPSIEDNTIQYDYIKNQEESAKNRFEFKEVPKSPRLKREISTGKDPPSRQDSDINPSSFPILPPPPQRKSPADPNKNNADLKTQNETKSSSPKSKNIKSESSGSILNITLNQLDKSGLENLAVTLGIPSENIYNMTLQELTKRLAQKYLGSSEPNKSDQSENGGTGDTFQADFDANFSKTESKKDSPPPFDKYAAFKELIENENKKLDTCDSESKQDNEIDGKLEQNHAEGDNSSAEIAKNEEEDRYAALRQLSLCAQKSENLSEEFDVSNEDDSSARADNISDIMRQHTEDSFTPLNTLDLTNDSPITKSAIHWPNQSSLETEEKKDKELEMDQISSEKSDVPQEPDWVKCQGNKETEPIEKDLFATSRPTSEEKQDEDNRDNWATFEKVPSFDEIAPMKPGTDNLNENENSPFSSDGKEDVKEVPPFKWHQKVTRVRGRNDVPWQDEDESWDDYSPKESYWSDESSHEDHSPDKRNEDRYQRRSWSKHARVTKGPPWNDKSEQYNRRSKWHEDTEDEYDDSWRKHRCRGSSFDGERKNDSWQVNDYDGYEKPFDRCNSRGEPWEENERYSRGYGERRKRSESDDEYRRRCDSDASDREYVWTFKRGYPSESFGRSEKQKQYYMQSYSSRDWQDRCHESRSKHKKAGSHKRPSSASETKRNYEKMYSPVDHMPRSMDKVPPIKRESEEEDFSPRFHGSHKDSRYHFVFDSGHHYNSYDRRSQTMHSKRMSRGSRNDSVVPTQNEVYSPPSKPEDKLESKEKPFHYFPSDSLRDQNSKNKKSEEPNRSESTKSKLYQFEDDFTPGTFEKQIKSTQSPKRDISRSPRRKRFDKDDWIANNKSSEDSFFPPDNNNENFANFNDDLKESPKKSKDGKPKGESMILPKPHGKGKNHFAMLSRQDSSASLRKSESINIFSRENDPFEDDDFFSSTASNNAKLSRFSSEKSKSNSNVSDPFTWKEVFGDSNFQE